MAKSLASLRLELKRIDKYKAVLEREISELEFNEMLELSDSKGVSFDKIYTIDYGYIKWYHDYIDSHGVNPLYLNYEYRIQSLDEEYVRVTEVNDLGHNLSVPYQFLKEVEQK